VGSSEKLIWRNGLVNLPPATARTRIHPATAARELPVRPAGAPGRRTLNTVLHSAQREEMEAARALAAQAFSRAAGASLIEGNSLRLLIDAAENYPAWLAAIASARHHVHFESYIIHEDSAGQQFADAMIAKARQGVRVRLIYDWMGALGKTSRRFWNRLRAGGVEVRCYNPPRFELPLGWLSRDHRKMLVVDGEIGFITGLCVGRMWVGMPEKKIEPWRDTGVEIRGPAVAEIERAFAQVWALIGEAIPHGELIGTGTPLPAGHVSLRVVATVPATAGMFRLD
jgi:cardiolipin synthase A/B